MLSDIVKSGGPIFNRSITIIKDALLYDYNNMFVSFISPYSRWSCLGKNFELFFKK